MVLDPLCFDFNGAPGATRTRGTGIRNPLLYPPELRGHTYSLYILQRFFKRKVVRALTCQGSVISPIVSYEGLETPITEGCAVWDRLKSKSRTVPEADG